MMSGQTYRQRRHHLEMAERHFIRAAAAVFGEGDGEALALIESGLGLFELAKADPEQKARERAEAWLAGTDAAPESGSGRARPSGEGQ